MVKQYSRLDLLLPNTWGLVTQIVNPVTFDDKGDVSAKVTNVTEGLLRNILDLTEYHQAADEIGWSRSKIRDFANLDNISPIAWNIIGAECQKFAPIAANGNAPSFGANAPFTEGLLRNILDLTEPSGGCMRFGGLMDRVGRLEIGTR